MKDPVDPQTDAESGGPVLPDDAGTCLDLAVSYIPEQRGLGLQHLPQPVSRSVYRAGAPVQVPVSSKPLTADQNRLNDSEMTRTGKSLFSMRCPHFNPGVPSKKPR